MGSSGRRSDGGASRLGTLRGGRGGGSPKIEPNWAAAGKVVTMAMTMAAVTIRALEKLAAISG
jgi:hypothetical protein